MSYLQAGREARWQIAASSTRPAYIRVGWACKIARNTLTTIFWETLCRPDSQSAARNQNAGVQITTSGYGAAANAYSSVEVTGKGSFSGVIGAELIVTTYDVTDAKNARLVNQRTVPIDLD